MLQFRSSILDSCILIPSTQSDSAVEVMVQCTESTDLEERRKVFDYIYLFDI